METLIKSRDRVADHGEVWTPKHIVNAMLDLVQSETERIDSLFLEPACGTGNFLDEILERKLAKVKKVYRKNQLDYERYAVLAVGSVYGIDIQEDNVKECRSRLFEIFDSDYTGLFGRKTKEKCRTAVRYILDRNIIHGNALTLKTGEPDSKPIIFSQWKLVAGSKFKRHDYAFHDLTPPEDIDEMPLFRSQRGIVDRDDGEKGFIPVSIKNDYPLTAFWELADVQRQ